jgi:hypothetical protein
MEINKYVGRGLKSYCGYVNAGIIEDYRKTCEENGIDENIQLQQFMYDFIEMQSKNPLKVAGGKRSTITRQNRKQKILQKIKETNKR